MKDFWSSLSFRQRVISCVSAVHLLLVLGAIIGRPTRAPLSLNSRPLQVQTITLAPAPPPKPTPIKKHVAQAKPTPKAKATPSPKTAPKPKVKAPNKQPSTSKQQPKTPAVNPKKVELARKIQQQLAQAQIKSKSPSSPKKIPTPESANSSRTQRTLNINYEKGLSSHFQKMLCLPEFGAVEVELTLDRHGKLSTWKILSSCSDVNRRYVAEALPKLYFPRFQDSFPGESTHHFLITLSNQF